jgi:hypothetical protein
VKRSVEKMEQPLVSIVSPSTVVSEGVYQFLRGSIYGAIWGMVSVVVMELKGFML